MLNEITIQGTSDPLPDEAEPDKRTPIVRQQLYDEVAMLIFTTMSHHGVSQAELARMIGRVAPTGIRRALRAKNLRVSTLADIADAMGYRVKVSFVAMGDK